MVLKWWLHETSCQQSMAVRLSFVSFLFLLINSSIYNLVLLRISVILQVEPQLLGYTSSVFIILVLLREFVELSPCSSRLASSVCTSIFRDRDSKTEVLLPDIDMSSKRCCVPQCVEVEGSYRVLHWFPNPDKDIARFRTWVHAIGGEIMSLSNENINKLRRVCHAHFEEKYCCQNNKISNIAVPTLLMPGW